MLKKAQVVAVLFAWFLSTGAQWDVLQTFGWGRMMVGYAQSMSFTAAVRETFEGELCPVCRAVKRGKQEQSESSLPTEKFGSKLLVTHAPIERILAPIVVLHGWIPKDVALLGKDRAAPPTPPPRA